MDLRRLVLLHIMFAMDTGPKRLFRCNCSMSGWVMLMLKKDRDQTETKTIADAEPLK